MADAPDRELTRCATCRAFGPDVQQVGVTADYERPVYPWKQPVSLCRPCRVAQGFEPARELPRPSVVKGQPGEAW